MRVLVVEDEIKLARAIELELEYEGYDVEVCHDGKEGLAFILSDVFDLVLLDIMLPELSGIDVLRRVRKQGVFTPIILLTARDQVYDKVAGLDYGADDYLTKPFEIEELLARIRVQLRERKTSEMKHGEPEGVIKIGELIIDSRRYMVIDKDHTIDVTKREFDLLYFLATHKNQVISRDQLLSQVWGFDYLGETNVVDVYIRYLRQKINYDLIKTVRGVGYMIKDESQ
ncbi:DNA-binding response OmpR family regulator [Streptohalobacillus salinus]|uniref:DNA-binding response OmpR family regulator n=1 Tax=Streptohalobacillus salinus TaxID=621096 RepID=A0A2V3WJH4_9BACI|nr:DNA-binding response OmpR family regulator [Streptohalobacillus salinus]